MGQRSWAGARSVGGVAANVGHIPRHTAKTEPITVNANQSFWALSLPRAWICTRAISALGKSLSFLELPELRLQSPDRHVPARGALKTFYPIPLENCARQRCARPLQINFPLSGQRAP
jgi:hypothetical protein